MDLINSGKKEENEYNFKKAIAFYQRALLQKDDDDFYTFLPTVYTRLAICFQNISDWFNSLRYFDMALEFFTSAGDTEKINEMKLNIANIFYITFKHDKAQALLSDILSEKDISNELKIKTYLLSATLSNEDVIKSYSLYKKALDCVQPLTDKQLLCELYFKYALCCDDLDETENAVLYYKKCSEIEKNNPHLSASLSNLALIFDETGMTELAIRYYVKSLNIDEQNENNNGIYVSSMKLAELTGRKTPEKAAEYYQKAIKSANTLNEPLYTLSAYVECGDFYMNHKKIKHALKYYMLAANITDANEDMKQKIQRRINDLKIRLGNKFEELEKEILYEK